MVSSQRPAKIFGHTKAVSLAIEEQNRKTLHGHMQIWIKGYQELRQKMFFGNFSEQRKAKATIVEYHQRIASTSMFSETSTYKLSSIFDHKCSHDNKYTRMLPLVVSDQVLRDLQHRKGYKAHGGKFASCIHCRAQWTNEQMVCSYLSNTNKIILPDKDPNIPASYVKEVIPEDRLMTHIIKYQKSNDNSRYAKPVEIINAVYNNHVSCHVRSCFKCQGVKKKCKHICGEKCECRYHFPDKGRPNALVRYIKDGGVRWFSWNGSEYLQPLVEFLPKRNCYDLFQNVCCPAISHSKLTCNSNIALITDGPLSQYQFKYQLKKTQKEDTMDYEDCLQSMKSMNGRSHDQDKPEAVRVIC